MRDREPMALTLQDGLLLAAAPAALGYVVALAIAQSAIRDLAGTPADPRRLQILILSLAIPVTGVVFGLLSAFLATGKPEDVRLPLVAVGVATFAQCAIQGWIMKAEAPKAAEDPTRLGRMIAFLAAPEALTVAAVLWFFLSLTATGTSGT